MRYFFFFSSNFLEWPLAIARELYRRDPRAEFMGLVLGKEGVYRKIREHPAPSIRPLYDLSLLEKEWLAAPASTERLRRYEEMLGSDVLNRIVASSRHIGRGWISGARVTENRLTRLSRNPESIRRYVSGLVDSLFEVFEERRPDLVFCYVVSEAPSYALGKVSEHFRVPFRRFTYARVGAQCVLDDTPEGVLGEVCRTYRKALLDPTPLRRFLPEARALLAEFRSMPEKPEYQRAFDRGEARKRSVLGIPAQLGEVLLAGLKALRGEPREWHVPSDWERRTWQLGVTVGSLKLGLRSPFLAAGEFPPAPFAYYPLHIDPEESTMVRAPLLTNQLAVVEALSKSVPFGMNLAVKEHPTMLGRRPAGFYEALAGMPKVFLTSPFASTFDLIRRSELTCTITGTVAWEAMMLGKPALVLGEGFPYLNVGEGVEHCQDLSALPAAVARALKRLPADDRALELFIAAILRHGFVFPAGLLWGKVSRRMIEDNRPVLEAICGRLAEAAGKPVVGGAGRPHHAPARGAEARGELTAVPRLADDGTKQK